MHSSRLSAILTLVLVLSMIGYVARPVSGLTSCGAEPDFRITASITSLTVRAGSSNSTRLTLRSFYGFTGTVNLTATPASPDLTVGINPSSATLSAGGLAVANLTVAAGASTQLGNYTITVAATSGSLSEFEIVYAFVPGPDFNILASPFSSASSPLTVPLGSSVTSMISLTSLDGFSGNVTLSSTVFPGGPALSLAPVSVSLTLGMTGRSSLNFTALSSTVPGLYQISIAGTSGSLSHGVGVYVNVAGPTFEVSVSPGTLTKPLTIPAGSSKTSSINVTSLYGFKGNVSLVPKPLFTITATLSSSLLSFTTPGSLFSTLNITTLSSARPGLYAIRVDALSPPLFPKSVFVHVLVPGPDFNITTVDSLTILPGSPGGSAGITLNSLDGFKGTVSLTLSCSPPGLSASIAPPNVTLASDRTNSSTLAVAASSSVPTGVYLVMIEGTNGTIFHDFTVQITVSFADFTIGASPSSIHLLTGEFGTMTISATLVRGFTGPIGLMAYPPCCLHQGVKLSAALSTTRLTGSGTSSLTVWADAPGTYKVTVTGMSGTLSHTVVVTMIVASPPPPDFSISPSSASSSIHTGGTATWTITLASLNRFDGTVALTGDTALGLSFSPVSVTLASGGTGTSTLTVSTLSSTIPGRYNITITAASGSTRHQTTVMMTVTALSPESSASNIPGPNPVVFYGLLGLATGILVGAVVFLWRRKSSSPASHLPHPSSR